MTDARPVGDMRAVQRSLNCCRTSVYKLMREDPEFPAPFTIFGKVDVVSRRGRALQGNPAASAVRRYVGMMGGLRNANPQHKAGGAR